MILEPINTLLTRGDLDIPVSVRILGRIETDRGIVPDLDDAVVTEDVLRSVWVFQKSPLIHAYTTGEVLTLTQNERDMIETLVITRLENEERERLEARHEALRDEFDQRGPERLKAA